MKKTTAVLLGLAFASSSHAADTINLDNGTPTQATFRTIVSDMGGAFNFKALNPAEPQGLIGFDLSVNATYAEVSDKAAWQTATGENIEQIGSIGVKLSKGLPLGLDVSGFYNIVPGTDASFWGAAVSYALEEGSIIAPAVAIRLGYTKGQGIEDFDFETKSIDFTVSKGFTAITPYAGIGQVFITGTPTSTTATALLDEEDFSETRVFAGAKVNLGFQLAVEYEKTGDIDTISARLGFGL
jgi:hypothetical protein